MAHSPSKFPGPLLALCLAAFGGAVAAAEAAREQPISVDAASSNVDYKTHTIVLKDITISQGTTRVQADHAHATGMNFENSRWTFEGNVRISAEPRGNLRSDQAVVEFHDNRIAKATITGKPAEFEQKRTDSDQLARGHADQITYDVSDGTVRLADGAWLSDGKNEISGPLLVYNIRGEHVEATTSPGTDERVHIVITPESNKGAGKSEPPKAPSATPPATAPQQNSPQGSSQQNPPPSGTTPQGAAPRADAAPPAALAPPAATSIHAQDTSQS